MVQKLMPEKNLSLNWGFLVCNRLQISSDAQNHAAYLSHWAEILKEGPKVLFKVLSDATKASNLILGAEVTED